MKMNRKTASFILLTLAAAAFASAALFPAPAAAVPGGAKNLSGGSYTSEPRWIAFGRRDGKPILWRVLEIGRTDQGTPMAFLFAEDAVAKMEFDSSSNDWVSSDLARWLNDDFYYGAFSDKEQGAIVNTTYYYGGKNKGSDDRGTSKVFLLSTDEANNEKFFKNDATARLNHLGGFARRAAAMVSRLTSVPAVASTVTAATSGVGALSVPL
jgi:hypothetical protein